MTTTSRAPRFEFRPGAMASELKRRTRYVAEELERSNVTVSTALMESFEFKVSNR